MAMRSGAPIPERIANKPQLYTANEFYLSVFYELIDNINWKTIIDYGLYYRLSNEIIEDLIVILPQLQSEYNRLRKKVNSNEG